MTDSEKFARRYGVRLDDVRAYELRNIEAKNYGYKDKKVLSALAGLKNFHRNPVVHPDDRPRSCACGVRRRRAFAYRACGTCADGP